MVINTIYDYKYNRYTKCYIYIMNINIKLYDFLTQPGGLANQPGSQPVTSPDKWGVLASGRASGRKNSR